MTNDKNAPVKTPRKRLVKSRTRSGCATCELYITNEGFTHADISIGK
jgi:hypothetical protein